MLGAVRNRLKRLVLSQVHKRNESRRPGPGQLRHIAQQYWGATYSESGDLTIGNGSVAELAKQFGTPLYVVDRQGLERAYTTFIGGFQRHYPKVNVGYSYKTNPLPGVIAELHRLGAWAEVISHFELWLALRLGVPGERILFNGPAKTPEAIELAVREGVAMINIDSLAEVEAVARSAEHWGRVQPVGVRIVTSVGWSSQFGLGLLSGDAFAAFRRIKEHPSLAPTALHFHLGTGIRETAIYLKAVGEMLEFAGRLKTELGVEISHLDLGGGFGVPTVRPMSIWDHRLVLNGLPPGPVDVDAAPRTEDYASAIASLVRQHYGDGRQELPTIYFEPGRALTSGAQCLVLRVLAVKTSANGRPTVILDGGKNIAMPTGYEVHELLPVSGGNETATQITDFFGPLCHPADQLFTAKPFRRLAPGDLVAIMDAGAYFVPNQMNFSNPRPAAVLVDNGKIRRLRERETFSDIVRLDHIGRDDRVSGQRK